MFAFYEGVPTELAEPGIYLYDPSYKKDKTQSLQDRAVFRPGVISENKDTGKIGRMNAVLYLEATE